MLETVTDRRCLYLRKTSSNNGSAVNHWTFLPNKQTCQTLTNSRTMTEYNNQCYISAGGATQDTGNILKGQELHRTPTPKNKNNRW